MYAYIQGKITHKDPSFVIIDVQGVGYEIRISFNTYEALEKHQQYKLFTYLHVKEDAQLLFGFAKEEEKKLFLDFLSISGIGPSLALMLLSSMRVDELKTAISQGEVKTIQKVKGIGAKTAQRLVLELQDKINKEGITAAGSSLLTSTTSGYNTVKSETLSALVNLGMSRATAEKNIEKALSEWQKSRPEQEIRLEDLFKLALKTS
ncbi:MAG: Holliday junction branch migration protein RuvA [Cyclobacteriaceae bacterium]